MIFDNERGSAGQPVDQNQSKATDVSRRKALGRLGIYTAPAMLALLLSEPATAATAVPF